eukprot:2599417-Rhodomonas_salina.2
MARESLRLLLLVLGLLVLHGYPGNNLVDSAVLHSKRTTVPVLLVRRVRRGHLSEASVASDKNY